MTESAKSGSTWKEIEHEADSLLAAASDAGLTLRLVGSTGIRMHCETASALMDGAGRSAKDIDLISSRRDRKRVRKLLEQRGYETDRDVLVAMEGERFCLRHRETGIDLDVLFDRLEFCHTIELGSRLNLHPRTIPVEDLLLQKLQVHDITQSDVADAVVVLAAHEVGDSGDDPEVLQASYVAGVLARDWGFHRTATENLQHVAGSTGQLEGIGPDTSARAHAGAASLLDAIERAPKTMGWRVRARVGERMQWWDEVDERSLTY